jgi:hypothetical protein
VTTVVLKEETKQSKPILGRGGRKEKFEAIWNIGGLGLGIGGGH